MEIAVPTSNIDSRGEDFKCSLCENTFSTEVKLTAHILTDHKRKEKLIAENNKRNAKLQNQSLGKKASEKCEFCGKQISKRNMSAHVSYQHQSKSLKCTNCTKVFQTNQNLRRHIRIVHDKVKDAT